MHGKNRKYLVYLSVSSSGPAQGEIIKINRNIFRTRSGANLKYTTSDCDWFYSHAHTEPYTENQTTKHIRLINPTSTDFAYALTESVLFLKQYIDEPDWDGGGIVLIYAGHGLKNTGALVFTNKCLPLEARDFLSFLATEMPRSNRRLRIDALIDSCYSGGFIANLIYAAHHEFGDSMFPCTLFAASLPDEPAVESDKFKHGVFTYSYIQGDQFPSFTQPRWLLLIKVFLYTKLGKDKCRLIEGGVNYLTNGRQNSMEYENGHFEVHSKGSFRIESEQYNISDIYSSIKKARDMGRSESFCI